MFNDNFIESLLLSLISLIMRELMKAANILRRCRWLFFRDDADCRNFGVLNDIQLVEYGYLFIILMFTKHNEHGCACFRGDEGSFA